MLLSFFTRADTLHRVAIDSVVGQAVQLQYCRCVAE
jgi:hypothetical protein